eukprot:6397311-Pyramimonas_sp.AAC.1
MVSGAPRASVAFRATKRVPQDQALVSGRSTARFPTRWEETLANHVIVHSLRCTICAWVPFLGASLGAGADVLWTAFRPYPGHLGAVSAVPRVAHGSPYLHSGSLEWTVSLRNTLIVRRAGSGGGPDRSRSRTPPELPLRSSGGPPECHELLR